ncbi:MAG: 3-(cis-5,6-dihydroxycyclohexa-1,3-dien-1-yl)propanoate dehydrogenase [Alphaproteobacteria bacterium]|nr:3-(cis-5,6-dihydroxycyclohexa-1,3-dien-1-yl)propanoate dehydrogenase [Alphaproteobacteria bacterium]
MGQLDGQVALVTGGGSGIGAAVVARYLEEGAKVGVLVRDQAQADTVSSAHQGVAVTIGDVRSLEDNEKAVAATVAAHGRLDVFVGNAGIWDFMVSLENTPREQLASMCDEIFSVNVKGYLLGARAALPELRKTKGCMIFTASTSSYFTGGGGPVYVAAKHAVLGLIRQLAHELTPDIRVNGVAPGGTLTPLTGSSVAGQGDMHLSAMPGIDVMIGKTTPLGFIAQPDNHTGHYVLLASRRDGAYTTGTVILSDGGVGIGRRAR